MDRGEELCSPTAELMAKLVSDEITQHLRAYARLMLGARDVQDHYRVLECTII